jgi:hypothetical protein
MGKQTIQEYSVDSISDDYRDINGREVTLVEKLLEGTKICKQALLILTPQLHKKMKETVFVRTVKVR